MDLKKTILQIKPVNGYPYHPSCVCEPGDEKSKNRLRSVCIHGDSVVEINATGRCLDAIKEAIREKCPDVQFADEQTKPKPLKESADATAKKS